MDTNINISKLVKQAQETNNRKAFEELYNYFQRIISSKIFKMIKDSDLADELSIVSIGKAFSRINKYKPDYAFSTWLGRIATNTTIDYIRKKKSRITIIDKELIFSDEDMESDTNALLKPVDDSLTPIEALYLEDNIRLVNRLISKLPENKQKLVRLRYLEELSVKEIAEKTGYPLGTIKAYLNKSRFLLKEFLEEESEEFQTILEN